MSGVSTAALARALEPGLAPIVFTDGDKGGTGKSFVARILAYLLTDAGRPWSGFDMDPRNGHLDRFRGQMQVIHLDWTEPGDWNRLYDGIIEADPTHKLLIDLPAQVGTVAKREFPRLFATADYVKRPVFRFWSLTRGFDSINLLAQTLDLCEAKNTFAVLNLRGATEEGFRDWNKSKTRARLLEGGGLDVVLPELPSGVVAEIDAGDLSFHEALSSLKQPYFRFDIESYLTQIRGRFAEVMERLA